MAPGRRLRDRRGVALLEALICMMILMIAVTAVFSVAVATVRTRGVFDPYEAGTRSVESVAAMLGNYVTADASAATASLAPNGTWRLPGDAACGYALQVGCAHDATALIPQGVLAQYPDARLTYAVSAAAAGPDPPLKVDFQFKER
ncbi:MAG: hypothetical protein HY554_14255 [Elusimicrobia bacterium]|nr:hypothetical protein [Elusimicrobiota bacterium]